MEFQLKQAKAKTFILNVLNVILSYHLLNIMKLYKQFLLDAMFLIGFLSFVLGKYLQSVN